MTDAITLSSPAGDLVMRPERDDDEPFRFELFCASRQPDFARLLAPDVLDTIMRQQFHAQAVSYRARFPQARGDIIELGGTPIGRIMIDRGDWVLHIVEQAIHSIDTRLTVLTTSLVGTAAQAVQSVDSRLTLLTSTLSDGTAQVTPWLIDYKRFNDPRRNRFFASPPEIEHKVG